MKTVTLKEEQIFISRVNGFVQKLVRNCKHCTSGLNVPNANEKYAFAVVHCYYQTIYGASQNRRLVLRFHRRYMQEEITQAP